MNRQPLMVVSTVHHNSNGPESALVAFSQTRELEIIFQTQNDTRKFKNLQSNTSVSAVIGFSDKEHITMQYEGNARVLKKTELENAISIFKQKKTPCGDEFIYHPKAVFILITPKWISLSDYRGNEPKIFEYRH